MIKLILSDVDGTLLGHGEEKLPDKVFRVIDELLENNIMFAAASGRGYPDLAELFDKVKDRIAFVCSDGAMTVFGSELLDISAMDRALALSLIHDIENFDGCEYLLYGRDNVYAAPKTAQYGQFLESRFGSKLKLIQNPSETEDDFLKVAVYAHEGIEKYSQHFIDGWQDKFDVVYNSNVWMEFVAGSVSKVTGVRTLCSHFGIDISEVMAFGDGGNDVKLLQAVGEGYAMEHSKDYVKDAADHVTDDVMDTIEYIIKEKCGRSGR